MSNKLELMDTSLRTLQLKYLEMLEYFQDFCKENDLEFFLCGGTCLGAVRHSGFIPWDDDVDLFMKRKDYEKLGEIWNEKADSRYKYIRANEKYSDFTKYTTIRDSQTTCIRDTQVNIDTCHGIALEILPLDGYPNSGVSRKLQIMWALLFALFCNQTAPDNRGRIIKYICKIILLMISSQKYRYTIWKYAEKQMSKYSIDDCEYITELCTVVSMKNKYPKRTFDRVAMFKFENRDYPIPGGYDEYLTILYGDYRKLPSEENRRPKHDVVYWNMSEPYTKFKGIYYLKESK